MYRTSLTLISFASASLLTMLACSSAKPNSGFDTDGNNTATPGAGSSGSSGILGGSSGSSGSSGTTTGCVPDPANAEIAGNNCDDDGDGTVDNVKTCDSASTGADANDFAKSMGICDDATTGKFGLVSAHFTNGFNASGAPNAGQYGALPKFGSVLKPREGAVLGVLSTGFAAEYDSAGGGNALFVPGKQWGTTGTAPPGFPKAAAGCGTRTDVHDLVNIHLELKAPANATGFQFDFNFHSSEWPAYICSDFNDSFVAYLSAAGFNGGKADNMSFDSKNNPVSVNNSFLDRCTDGATIGCLGQNPGTASCPAGTGELAGTGFGSTGNYCLDGSTSSGGATGWLTSKAAVNPGETFTLDLMIWDTGDSKLDSLVLLDNFQWIGGAPVQTSTDRPK